MKTKFFNATCKVLGAGHFIAQSSADLLLNAEGNIASKHLGKDKVEVMKSRVDKTNAYQERVVTAYAKRMAMFSKKP